MRNSPPSERSERRSQQPTTRLPSPLDVLYVTHASPDDRTAPSTLETEHGIDVRVVSAFPAAVSALTEESADCIVASGGNPAPAWQELLEYVDDRRPDLPVIAYADSDGDPRTWFRAGADDYLCRDADTDRCTLLAHRIEQCVASRRAHAGYRRFRTSVEAVDHPFLIADPDGQIEYVNEAFETLLGYDRNDFLDRPLTALQAAANDDAVYRACWETVTGGDSWSGELLVSGDDGTYPIDLTVTPVRDGSERVERIVAVGTEIAERKSYQRELEDTRQKYRELIDAAPDAIFVADTDTGEILEANDAAAGLVGRPRSELVGMHQSTLHPDDERERYRRLCDRYREEGESVLSCVDDEPLSVETADGDQVPVEISARVVELDDRTLLQGHFRDVSDRRDQERKLRAILEAIPDIAIVYGEDGTYEEVLTDHDDLLVDTPDALEGSDIHDALPGEPADRIQDAIRETVETGEIQKLEYRLRLDGDPHYFEARISPLRTDAYTSEKPVVFLARDITTRKRREQDFRSFRQAVEHAGHVIMITDTDGRVEYVNPAFESVTGYSKEDALGETPAILNSGEHDDACYRELWETITDGQVWEGELINQRKGGEQYHIEQTIAPITDEMGTIERFVAVNTDITDRKQYEDQLERERDRLEEFARTVAHDLRNPLSIAIGHVDIARQAGDDDPTLDRALSALERMETMIDEVLTLSKQGETVREPEPIRFDRVVDTAWEHADTAAASRSMTENLDGWTLPADEPRLRQLLENLFRNAVEHGTTGSRLESDDPGEHAEADVTIRIGRLPDRKGFFVEDDGPGIDPTERQRIFESGFTSADDGTGFGLAIVKQIVDAHGWEIRVTDAGSESESEYGNGGARFEIITAAYRDHAADGA